MLEQLSNLISQNPLLTTVYSGGIVAVIVTNFRAIMQFLKDKILYLISFTVLKVSNIGYCYMEDKNDLEIFLKQQKHIFQKSYELTDRNDIREGFGISWYIIFGKLVCVSKDLDTSKFLDYIPLKRLGEVEDIAKTVKFLAADADYITGQVVEVDGGLII